jgi:mersacidin/lichenicidin family type 2 lantibiotic
MTPSDIIRAWKDPSYRASLPSTQLARLPAHPAGAIERPEPTLHAARHPQGFRAKSGLRAGLAAPTQVQQGCSASGDNLWHDDLTRQ